MASSSFFFTISTMTGVRWFLKLDNYEKVKKRHIYNTGHLVLRSPFEICSKRLMSLALLRILDGFINSIQQPPSFPPPKKKKTLVALVFDGKESFVWEGLVWAWGGSGSETI